MVPGCPKKSRRGGHSATISLNLRKSAEPDLKYTQFIFVRQAQNENNFQNAKKPAL